MPKQLALRRDIAEIARATAWMEGIAAQSAWSSALIFRLRLCLEEAMSNVIRHGRGGAASDILLSLEEQNDGVTVCVEDEGDAFDPTQHPPLEPPSTIASAKVGGFGIALMRRFATEVSYQRVGRRNRLLLVFDRV